MIELIPFTEADIDRLTGWIPSLEVHLFWTASVFEYPLPREPFAKFLRDSAERGDRLIYKAVLRESGEACGHIELGAIDRRNRFLRIGRVLLNPAFRGRGLGMEMMRSALALAFDDMDMHRVELGVFDVNPGAIACYERVGFRHEGVRRESFKAPEGAAVEYWSEVTMSILASEWRGGIP
ncbi:MAG TPA: GNAT family protein [Thermoanaerobaculia bacterium]|nr:GNAT family protein [Thermoanaerobaculia bacterium]